MIELECEICMHQSADLNEVCYYDNYGNKINTEEAIDSNLNNIDAFAHVLCTKCAKKMKFNFQKEGVRVCQH